MKMTAEESLLTRIGIDFQSPAPGCCGMAGSFGFERDNDKYDISQAIGELELLPAVRRAPPDWLIIADGFSCREQIAQGTDRHALHLAEVLQMALDPSVAHQRSLSRIPRSPRPRSRSERLDEPYRSRPRSPSRRHRTPLANHPQPIDQSNKDKGTDLSLPPCSSCPRGERCSPLNLAQPTAFWDKPTSLYRTHTRQKASSSSTEYRY